MTRQRWQTERRARTGRTRTGALAAMVTMALVAGGLAAGTNPVAADTSSPSNIPYSCTTNVGVNQAATYGATITDSADPAAVGQSVTYRFVVPFAQDPPPVTATYKGGSVTYPIPAGLTVTSVSTPPKAGSNLTSTAVVQGGNIITTSTGNQPIDGGTHPTPDLVVVGTITNAAAGPGVVWRTPSKIVANVDAQFIGAVVATCQPDNPSAVIATTAVPAGAQTPKPTNKTIAVVQGKSKAVTLSATDSDTPVAQLTYSVATPPAHGSLTGTAPNLTYTAAARYVGNDSFTFLVRDPDGNNDLGTVTVRVLPPAMIDNVPPTVVITSPANGAVFTPTQIVKAAYDCSDATTAVESCVGTQASGANLPMTVGAHTLVVDAVDTTGNRAQETVSYRVINPALVTQSFNTGNTIPLACDDTLPLTPARTVPATVSSATQVGTGLTFTMRFAPGPRSVPALRTLTNASFTLDVPVNGATVSAAIVPGTGTANARSSASAAVAGGKAVLTIAGPIAGGNTAATAYTPPAIDVVIRASTTANAVVQTKLAQFKATESISGVGQVPLTYTCAAGDPANGKPNPILTRTTVIDTTPPSVTLTAPAKGGLYGVGAAVPMSYSCSDAPLQTSCVGTVPSGANVPTSTPGLKVLTVKAVDAAGNVAQRLVSLKVVQTSFTTRYATTELALLDEAAAFYATDRPGFAKYAVSVLRYVVSVNGAPTSLPAAPANNGSIAVVTTYSAAEAQQVVETAALYGLTGDQFHRFGAGLLLYIYSLQHP